MSTQARPVESQTEQYSLLGKEDAPVQAGSKKSAGAFRTISEVAESLNVPQHVLRFWETKFTQVKPLKRGGGRRYYRPEDVALLEKIHHLLYTEGYTIKGVQKLLREVGKAQILQGAVARPAAGVTVAQPVQQQAAAAQQAPKPQSI
ncbi:MAG TPA: MerR family transcriptional regulator, partial [Rhodospirillaceae bacterium]|nr:MerR family transcriptional regulator [Rhodospirillaceae bacterium]